MIIAVLSAADSASFAYGILFALMRKWSSALQAQRVQRHPLQLLHTTATANKHLSSHRMISILFLTCRVRSKKVIESAQAFVLIVMMGPVTTFCVLATAISDCRHCLLPDDLHCTCKPTYSSSFFASTLLLKGITLITAL